MKRFLLFAVVLLLLCASVIFPQRRRPVSSPKQRSNSVQKNPEIGQTAVVIDEKLSVLRQYPSLFSESIQRMRIGRTIQILGVAEADGVKFYKVVAPPRNYGWVQADSVFGKFRPSDEERLARVVQATDGFEQLEVAIEFFRLYPKSQYRAPILLLYGDLLEDVGAKLSKNAGNALKRTLMAASGAPLHSYYLNYVSLDRYRKLGVVFLFNSATRQYHYDGESWKEIIRAFPSSTEAVEAQTRIESLKLKLDKK